MSAQIPQKFGSMPRRLRLGMVGGGRLSFCFVSFR